ncbi:MAG TPA: hypothetical protein VKK06_12875 [Terriglobia bacterium]|nr:hypothetical protein [Terriglobia bacterium]
MKILLTMLMGLLLLVPACNRNEPSRVGAAPEERSTTANTEMQQRDAYVKSMQAKLDEFDKKLDGLDARASSLSGPQKDDVNNMVNQLRDQRKSIASQLDNVKDASPEAWPQMKSNVDSQLAMLERSYQEVSKQLESTPVTPSKKSY